MDPINRGPQDGTGPGGAAPARMVQLVAGEYVVTVNPVDGSEIEPCPPGRAPGPPRRHSPEERSARWRPPVRLGAGLPLLEREEERERLVRLLARGRSVRLTGPAGSGRTALLDAVVDDCAELAPDGVVRLNGYHRTPTDLLHDLHATVYRAELHRPDREELLTALAGVGAVVVVDDIEFGGAALDELLRATPECAFLIAATPHVAAPSPGSFLEEVFLGGISRTACLELLEHAVGRPLTDAEADWSADLWFESEGLPLRFVQAGAVLRQRDARLEADPDTELAELTVATITAGSLAAELSEYARDTLRLAVALDGELPAAAHLPALLDDPHADAALAELVSAGLATGTGTHHRLAAGVAVQLAAEGYGEDAAQRARTAAQHYAWWTGHPSVTAPQVSAEADTVLAAAQSAQRGGHASTAVLLAHTVAPVFAAGLHWSAWERALRCGQEAARVAGEVAEEAYFHHELGVLALCAGNLERARAELEAAIGLRGALADRGGTVVGRRALALVDDRSGATPGAGSTAVAPPTAFDTGGPALGFASELPNSQSEEEASPPGAPVPAAAGHDTSALPGGGPQPSTGSTKALGARSVLHGARRNVVAAAAGALLAAVLGTVVTLGNTSGGGDDPSDVVKPDRSATQEGGDGDLPADQPVKSGNRNQSPGPSGLPGSPGGPSGSASASESPDGDSTAEETPDEDATGTGSASGKPSTAPGKPSSGTSTTPGRPSSPGTPTGGSGGPGGGGPSTDPGDPDPSGDPGDPDPSGDPGGGPTDGTTDSASGPPPSASASAEGPTSRGPEPDGSTTATLA
ncbi:ATP-binding protein [Streptomyces sp. 549]|uniref:ATP-binding protein n=1 Tax=Streptomyces sp. 549 TaxID=3049076 RepID=UPI0024C29726|nr:ATP-binding protein [Streptomyces sp. 549]MDK1474859.1 ATP-binding protein [Streptomyces sp. 549]